MIEFLFGWTVGVWMGQQLPLPSVQTYIQNWYSPAVTKAPQTNATQVEKSSVEVSVPVFTGEMPPSV